MKGIPRLVLSPLPQIRARSFRVPPDDIRSLGANLAGTPRRRVPQFPIWEPASQRNLFLLTSSLKSDNMSIQ
jgi:hypothetical protein